MFLLRIDIVQRYNNAEDFGSELYVNKKSKTVNLIPKC